MLMSPLLVMPPVLALAPVRLFRAVLPMGLLLPLADMPVPVPLQMDRAAQLNEAYGQDEPLEKLLKRHRLLALRLGKAPQRGLEAAEPLVVVVDAVNGVPSLDQPVDEHVE